MMCSKCKKRLAVVFITRMEGDKSVNEGLCMVCAQELGIKPVQDIIDKMGITAEELEAMNEQMNSLMSASDEDSGRSRHSAALFAGDV